MEQPFTHTPTAPETPETAPHLRRFAYSFLDDKSGAGNNVSLMRFETEDKAALAIDTYGSQDVIVRVKTQLDADQCEALARYLLDAAHDLRTNPSHALIAKAAKPPVWPFPRDGNPAPWTRQQIAAHAAQERAELGEAPL